MKKNIIDLTNKFRLKHKMAVKVVKIILALVILSLLIYLAKKFVQGTMYNFMNNQELVIILASLLGASVGGLITYFININSMIKANHIKASIVNKNVSYSPLYLEYMKILNVLKEEDVLRFNRSIEYRTIGSTDYTVWERLKSDTRFFQLPDYLKKECAQVDEAVKKYENASYKIISIAFKLFVEILETNGYDITDNKNGITSFIKVRELIKGINSIKVNLLTDQKIYGMPEITVDDKEKIAEEFMEAFNQTEVICDFYTSKQELETKLTTASKTLETIIKRITNEYESRNNVF